MMYLVLPNSFRLARYFAPVALLAFVPLARPSADDYFPPPDAKGGWRTLSDPAKIAKTARRRQAEARRGVRVRAEYEPARRFAGGAPRVPGLRTVFRPWRPGGSAGVGVVRQGLHERCGNVSALFHESA
jgi:hypothetical protein